MNDIEPIGYAVLTYNPRGAGNAWRDNWDGEVHPTRQEGVESLAACRDAGHVCVLTELKSVRE